MFEIDNPKISGLIPKWSEFRGFSILFDNPDKQNNFKKLSCDLKNPKLELYKKLNQILLSFERLMNNYFFFRFRFNHIMLHFGM